MQSNEPSLAMQIERPRAANLMLGGLSANRKLSQKPPSSAPEQRCRDGTYKTSHVVGWVVGWKPERRLWLGSPRGFHNVLFSAAHDCNQLLLLFGRHLELVQRLVEIGHHGVPLGLGDVQVRIRLLHRAPDVLSRTPRDLTDECRHVEFEARFRDARSRPADGRLAVARGRDHHPTVDVYT